MSTLYRSLALVLLSTGVLSAQNIPGAERARKTVEAAIEAMGGDAFLKVRDIQSEGRLFYFKEGRSSGLIRYLDYTRIPDKSRFQIGTGKNIEVHVYDLAIGKGWIQEGKSAIKEKPEKEVKEFRRSIKHAPELLFRTRYKDPDVKLFYFGPQEISGGGDNLEAVEFLDSENDSTIVYFNRTTHLPVRIEYTTFDKVGIKHKEEVEYSNWQVIQGLKIPFNTETAIDGEKASQSFIEKISFNTPIPDTFFQRPVPLK